MSDSLERGDIEGVPLDERAVTGDLGDCRKLYFGLGNPPSHRIVYRDTADGQRVIAGRSRRRER